LEEFGELGVRTSRVTEHRVDRALPRQRARGVPYELPKLKAKFSNGEDLFDEAQDSSRVSSTVKCWLESK
jgi:hypothetical protein